MPVVDFGLAGLQPKGSGGQRRQLGCLGNGLGLGFGHVVELVHVGGAKLHHVAVSQPHRRPLPHAIHKARADRVQSHRLNLGGSGVLLALTAGAVSGRALCTTGGHGDERHFEDGVLLLHRPPAAAAAPRARPVQPG